MKAELRRAITGYAFILPWLVALVVFIGYPFFAAFYFSFCDFPPLLKPMFIGTENYRQLVIDPVFRRSLAVTLIYAAFAIPFGVFVALSLALLLSARIRGQTFYRVVFYLPHLVPSVVVALLWMWIFNPKFGIFNVVLGLLMRVADAWTGLFFRLSADGGPLVHPAAVLLLVGPVAALLAYGPWLKTSASTRHGGFRFAAAVVQINPIKIAEHPEGDERDCEIKLVGLEFVHSFRPLSVNRVGNQHGAGGDGDQLVQQAGAAGGQAGAQDDAGAGVALHHQHFMPALAKRQKQSHQEGADDQPG